MVSIVVVNVISIWDVLRGFPGLAELIWLLLLLIGPVLLLMMLLLPVVVVVEKSSSFLASSVASRFLPALPIS